MDFTLEETIQIGDRKVVITMDTEFRKEFSSIQDLLQTLSISAVGYISDELEDYILVSVETNKKVNDHSVAISKLYMPIYMDNTLRLLEEEEEYEMCSIFLKLKNEFNKLTNEK